MAQNVSSAVMQNRRPGAAPPDRAGGLDFFPTPPWATRALIEHLNIWGDVSTESALDPACGQGHMVRPLAEAFGRVKGSDIHDYGVPEQDAIVDFLKLGDPSAGLFDLAPPAWLQPGGVDWIITNPPFKRAADFARQGLTIARVGVALLVRIAFLEGGVRHRALFAPHPPEWILQFAERVPMLEGRLDPEASSATAYCWIVWLQPARPKPGRFPAFVWIPGGTRKRLERPGDYDPVSEAAP